MEHQAAQALRVLPDAQSRSEALRVLVTPRFEDPDKSRQLPGSLTLRLSRQRRLGLMGETLGKFLSQPFPHHLCADGNAFALLRLASGLALLEPS